MKKVSPPVSAAERIGATATRQTREQPDVNPQWQNTLQAWLACHKASWVDSGWRLARQPFGSFFTCMAMAVALSLPMGLALLLDDLERLSGSWQQSAQISLFLHPGIDEAAGLRLQAQLLEWPAVEAVHWISPTQALEDFQQFTGLNYALQELPENPLPGVVVVTPHQVDKAVLAALRTDLAALPEVELAQLDLIWVERLIAILQLGHHFVFGLSVLLIATLLLVIGNTIRLHIENRREEIEIVKLVGGTDSYVRRPFLYMGVLYGLGAGLLAWLGLSYGLDWLNAAVIRLAQLYGSDFALTGVSLEDGASLLLGALLLGYVGAWFAVGRHLSALEPA